MKHDVKGHQVASIDSFDMLRPVLLTALSSIKLRSHSDCTPQRSLEAIRSRVGHPDDLLWVTIDRSLMSCGINQAVCGVARAWVALDEVGQPMVFLGQGWIRPGYNSEPLDEFMPYLIQWAKLHGARRIRTQSDRCSLSEVSSTERHLLTKWVERMRALRAYAHWIGKYGFKMRETQFDLEIPL